MLSKFNYIFSLILLILTFVQAEVRIEKPDWKKHFDAYGEDGAFVLQKVGTDTMLIYNPARADQRFLPASTYKIIHSLIALETGVVKSPADTIYWDGKNRGISFWNRGQTLATALKYSAVWVFQQFAQKIGAEQMQYWVDTCHYGNRNIGGNINSFWLDGEIRISAIEQIHFLKKFYRRQLPFSGNNMKAVKHLLLVRTTMDSKMYAKTGWAVRTEKQIGWYVGFVENQTGAYLFALNMDISVGGNESGRVKITEGILREFGIIQANSD